MSLRILITIAFRAGQQMRQSPIYHHFTGEEIEAQS